MQHRALTINFQRSVTGTTPNVMEVAVAPLMEPNAPAGDATLVGGTVSQDVLLGNANNPVVFNLVPTDYPDLTTRVTYRIAWREKYMGRQFTKDFVMPDFDVAFDDLENLGNIIGGQSYLQWTDRSHPGGVAGLNDAGQVIDSEGNPVSGSEQAATVQGHLDAEVVARQQGDQFLRQYFLQFAQDQITQLYTTTAASLSSAVAQLQNADTIEHGQRANAIATVNNSLATLQAYINDQVAGINILLDETNAQFSGKADLVNGKVPSSQIPDIALGKAVPALDEAAMLALTTTQVQPGDFAVRPDGVFFLNSYPVNNLANWIQFTVAASVFSINGHTGAVVLSAADVGARSLSTPVPMADISGLASALSLKTDNSATNALLNRVTNIENDTSYVKKVSGLIVRADMPADSVFVNTNNLVTKKDGTVLNTGGGGTLDIEDVNGLQAALDAKLPSSDASVTNARTPIAHKVTHSIGGTDALAPSDIGAANSTHTHPQSDITGLVALLSDRTARISSLETRVENLELGGGGGGGGGAGASGKTVWYSGPTPINPLDTSTDALELRSPFGFDGTNYSYDPAGVDPSIAVWPYLTPNGHLKFIKRNEAAAVDAPLATQAALDALTTTVGTKASQSALNSLTTTVGTKANSSDLTTLSGIVDTKATITALNSLSDSVALKASQSALDALTTTVGTKASQSALDALTTTVAAKALASDLTALTTRVSTVETGKADLVSGTVPTTQIPSLAISKTTGLQSALDAKADLVSGTVPLAQLPSIGTNKVTGLDAALSQKADLDGTGHVPTSQLPSLSLTTAVSVANRSAMLALSTTQVQPGDICVITATSDKGSYILTATDPSLFGNWTKLVAPDDLVQSVNGQAGTVVLGASDVGARSSSVSIPQSDITGLTTALAAKADASALTTGLAGKTSPTDVQTILDASTFLKQKADLASTVAIASTSGQQSVDGTLAPLGAVVLLTAQASSVNNGLWIVNSGAWTRVTDMATGAYFVRGTSVVVTGGSVNSNTVWQETNSSGVVGTNANNWSKILTAGAAPNYTASLGVQKIGNDFRAQVVTGGGLQAVAGGLQRDPNVLPGKFAGDVPAGATVVTITHNLNTTDVTASFRDKAAGDAVLVGWKPTGVNTISAEFATAPSTGQWRVVVVG